MLLFLLSQIGWAEASCNKFINWGEFDNFSEITIQMQGGGQAASGLTGKVKVPTFL